jgi:hypothetical protein
MSVLKLNRRACVVLAIIAVLAATCQSAQAGPASLICEGFRAAASPSIITLDENKGLVTFHEGDTQIPGGSLIPGRTLGPVTAKFGKETITFEIHDEGRDAFYTLNRLTGAASLTGTYGDGSTMPQFDFTCHAAKSQF